MKNIFTSIILLFICMVAVSQVSVKNLRCENLNNPLGIDLMQPRLSWQIVSENRNTMQTAYEIKVSYNNTLINGLVWSSDKIFSDQSVYVSYAGTTLQAAKKYYWQVRVWDNTGKASAWSQPASWQMGLLQPIDWKAKWIGSTLASDTVYGPGQLYRSHFVASKKILSATIFITSHGMYEAHMNGKRIGDAYLTPGWTSYNKRLQYQVYDVTALLKTGENAIGVTIGSGWYRTPLGWGSNRNLYGSKTALLLQLEINYTDGSKEIIGSGDSWKCSDGPIRNSEIYDGETYDVNSIKDLELIGKEGDYAIVKVGS